MRTASFRNVRSPRASLRTTTRRAAVLLGCVAVIAGVMAFAGVATAQDGGRERVELGAMGADGSPTQGTRGTTSVPESWTEIDQAPYDTKAPEGSPILAAYDFEESHPSGPDTFWVYERGDLRVDLSTAFRVSGERSLRVTDQAGDGNFAEFLGYFPRRAEGAVFWQFYVLFTDVGDTHNFGVTGERWFLNFAQHGQAFWLQVRGGRLRHFAEGDWHDLGEVVPFRWYFVDWLYDVDRGTYDLALFAEGEEEPVVDVRGVRNPTGTKGSAVRYFSFIGDLDDETAPSFFVDDVLLAVDPELRLAPFVAPGRRQLFVDSLRRPAPKDADTARDLAFRARELASSWNAEDLNEEGLRVVESAADALVDAGDLGGAETLYLYLQGHPDTAAVALLKLADVHFLRGDAEGERAAREAIYGRLGFEPGSER